MVYGTYNYSYWGEAKPTYNWGASHCTLYMAIRNMIIIQWMGSSRVGW